MFSDIVMPGTIDGVGLATEVRSRYPHLPVILTTGYSDAAQAAPPDLKILRKPFDSDMLRGFIQDTMEMSHGVVAPAVTRVCRLPHFIAITTR